MRIRNLPLFAARRRRAARLEAPCLLVAALVCCLAPAGCRRRAEESAPDILSPAERAWMDARRGQLVIAPDPRWQDPSVAPDAYAGMEMDFVEVLQEKLGSRFIRYNAPTIEDYEKAVSEKRVDVLPAIRPSRELAGEWLFTRPYMRVPIVLLVNTARRQRLTIEEMKGLRIAVGRKYGVREFVEDTYGSMTVTPTKGDLDAMLDLSLGQLDVVVIDLATASEYIQQQGISNIRIAGRIGPSYDLSMACRADRPVLLGILNRGLDRISDQQKNRIYDRWIRFGEVPFYRNRVFWFWVSGVLSAIVSVIVAILIWNGTLRRRVEKATGELVLELAERKRAEAELSRARNELEKRVEERTRELAAANRNLVHEIQERREAEREVLEISGEERKRIGRDLHDSLGQELAGIACMTRVVSRRLEAAGSPESGEAAKISALIADAVSHAKLIVRGLMPVEIVEEGLSHALRRLADESSKILRVRCVFETEGPALVRNNDVATNLYRIAQEAIANAVQHGNAANIVVRLSVGDEDGVLTVRDDGSGVAENTPTGGMGMRTMRYRAEMCGGKLQVGSSIPSGTLITCIFKNRAVDPGRGGTEGEK